MHKLPHRLTAYTLIEITITMLIVAVLSAFVYYTLQTFSRLLGEQQANKMEQHTFDLLCHRIRWDSYQADSIQVSDENSLLLLDSAGTIEYLFLDSAVLRTQYALRTDTFHVRAGLPIISLAPYRSENPLVTSFELPLLLEGKTVYLPIRKAYSSKQLLGKLTDEQQ